MPDRHKCPWPSCFRMVTQPFWGCAPHWRMIPDDLRRTFVRTLERGSDRQSVDHHDAAERIRTWVSLHAAPDGVIRSDRHPSMDAGFYAGYASDGKVLLFWPVEGEYLLLEPHEADVLRRLLR